MPNCGETYSWLSGISYTARDWTEEEKQSYKEYEAKWKTKGQEIAKEVIKFLRENPDEMFYKSPPPEEFLFWQKDIPWLESLITKPAVKLSGTCLGRYVGSSTLQGTERKGDSPKLPE